MHKEESGDTANIPVLTDRVFVELDSAMDKESLGHNPYDNAPDTENLQNQE